MNNLSLKQLKFINKYLEEGNGTEAALWAYNTNDRRVAAQISYENLRKPDVKEAIGAEYTARGLTPLSIAQNCKDILNNGTNAQKLNLILSFFKVVYK